ncbi:WYL domain-containing protein [Rothia sp. HC945]|uniref:helix-turn-helix transcriptional regulator n=1 Tax=Rothia sp. HC945 TaxID=3171170 RepID=UPI003F245250
MRSALEQAITDQKVVRIQYVTNEGAESCRDVEPVLFASTGGRWYLIAWCPLRSAVRWFALSRVKKAVVTSEPCSGHDIKEVGIPPVNARSVSPHHR